MREEKKNIGKGMPSVRMEPSDRMAGDAGRDLTPEKVDLIMQAANAGDSREQCRLARELVEKNEAIAQAMETRKNAVMGCPWQIVPGGDGAREKAAAGRLQAELEDCGDGDEQDGFEDLLEDLVFSIIPGFLVSEILWVRGGEIAGFHAVPGEAVHFLDGFLPRLVTGESPQGIDLPRERFVFHRLRRAGNDPARGGLIRPLAWLHCFKQINVKDCLSFIERHGMPFVVAKVDGQAFQADWQAMRRLVRNFGPSGGGVITKNVELELLECTSTGEVYFRLLDYVTDAVEKLILGQVASSGESAGLSGGDAQSKVRQDILESDCRMLMRTVNIQVCRPWSAFNFGDGVRPPRLLIGYETPEDRLQLAQTVQTLSAAGLEADEKEMSERFGMKLTRRPPPSPGFGFSGEPSPGSVRALGGEGSAGAPAAPANVLEGWLSPAAALLEKLASEELSDDEFERELMALRDLGRGDVFGDSGQFERALGEHIADHMALGAGAAWRKAAKGGVS
jgi:phage gp29-like protein